MRCFIYFYLFLFITNNPNLKRYEKKDISSKLIIESKHKILPTSVDYALVGAIVWLVCHLNDIINERSVIIGSVTPL